MKRILMAVAALALAWLGVGGAAYGAELFRDPMNSGAGWGVHATSADTSAVFGYDYSADGVPEAPHSRAGDAATSGVKLEANLSLPLSIESVTVYPLGKSFSGDYQLQFDAWINVDLDEVFGSAVGTTEFLGGGVGYGGVAAEIGDGAQVVADGDGGSASDWRAFKSAFFVPAADMAGGTRDAQDTYYADFLPGVAPPASQGQTATPGVAGAPSFQWVTWEFNVLGDMVDVVVEKPGGQRLQILQMDGSDTSDGSSGFSTTGDISLFYGDFFTSVAPRPERMFGLVDNVVVSAIPEPSSLALFGLGACAASLLFRRRR